MQRVILHAVFMLLAKPTRADAEHHEPGAYFAGSLPGDLTAKLDLPDEWTLDKEAEVDTAARYVMQRVCRGAYSSQMSTSISGSNPLYWHRPSIRLV